MWDFDDFGEVDGMAQLLSIFGAIVTLCIAFGLAFGWLVGLFAGGWFVTAFGGILGFAGGVAILWYITSKWRVQ